MHSLFFDAFLELSLRIGQTEGQSMRRMGRLHNKLRNTTISKLVIDCYQECYNYWHSRGFTSNSVFIGLVMSMITKLTRTCRRYIQAMSMYHSRLTCQTDRLTDVNYFAILAVAVIYHHIAIYHQLHRTV